MTCAYPVNYQITKTEVDSSDDIDEFLALNAFRDWESEPQVFLTWQDNTSHVTIRKVTVSENGQPEYVKELKVNHPTGATSFEITSCSTQYLAILYSDGSTNIHTFASSTIERSFSGDVFIERVAFLTDTVFIRAFEDGTNIKFNVYSMTDPNLEERLLQNDGEEFSFPKTNTVSYTSGLNSLIISDSTTSATKPTMSTIQFRTDFVEQKVIVEQFQASELTGNSHFGENHGITFALSSNSLQLFVPVGQDLLNKGTDTIRYTVKITNNQNFTLPTSIGDHKWVVYDYLNRDRFLVAEGDPSGGKLTLSRVAFTKFKAICTLQESDLVIYANEIGVFYGDPSISRYGLKNSLSFLILNDLTEDFNKNNRILAFVILIISVILVAILGIWLGSNVFKNTNLILETAVHNFNEVNGSQKRIKAL